MNQKADKFIFDQNSAACPQHMHCSISSVARFKLECVLVSA
ncbi:MAG: hypothetical protein AABZ06_05825 [Bdellovibrionota bacterium]